MSLNQDTTCSVLKKMGKHKQMKEQNKRRKYERKWQEKL
jgi:hypothetical protein